VDFNQSETLRDKFCQLYTKHLLEYLKSANSQNSPFEAVLTTLIPIQASEHLMAPKLFQLTVDGIKIHLLSFDISLEIAKYIHLNGPTSTTKSLL